MCRRWKKGGGALTLLMASSFAPVNAVLMSSDVSACLTATSTTDISSSPEDSSEFLPQKGGHPTLHQPAGSSYTDSYTYGPFAVVLSLQQQPLSRKDRQFILASAWDSQWQAISKNHPFLREDEETLAIRTVERLLWRRSRQPRCDLKKLRLDIDETLGQLLSNAQYRQRFCQEQEISQLEILRAFTIFALLSCPRGDCSALQTLWVLSAALGVSAIPPEEEDHSSSSSQSIEKEEPPDGQQLGATRVSRPSSVDSTLPSDPAVSWPKPEIITRLAAAAALAKGPDSHLRSRVEALQSQAQSVTFTRGNKVGRDIQSALKSRAECLASLQIEMDEQNADEELDFRIRYASEALCWSAAQILRCLQCEHLVDAPQILHQGYMWAVQVCFAYLDERLREVFEFWDDGWLTHVLRESLWHLLQVKESRPDGAMYLVALLRTVCTFSAYKECGASTWTARQGMLRCFYKTMQQNCQIRVSRLSIELEQVCRHLLTNVMCSEERFFLTVLKGKVPEEDLFPEQFLPGFAVGLVARRKGKRLPPWFGTYIAAAASPIWWNAWHVKRWIKRKTGYGLALSRLLGIQWLNKPLEVFEDQAQEISGGRGGAAEQQHCIDAPLLEQHSNSECQAAAEEVSGIVRAAKNILQDEQKASAYEPWRLVRAYVVLKLYEITECKLPFTKDDINCLQALCDASSCHIDTPPAGVLSVMKAHAPFLQHVVQVAQLDYELLLKSRLDHLNSWKQLAAASVSTEDPEATDAVPFFRHLLSIDLMQELEHRRERHRWLTDLVAGKPCNNKFQRTRNPGEILKNFGMTVFSESFECRWYSALLFFGLMSAIYIVRKRVTNFQARFHLINSVANALQTLDYDTSESQAAVTSFSTISYQTASEREIVKEGAAVLNALHAAYCEALAPN